MEENNNILLRFLDCKIIKIDFVRNNDFKSLDDQILADEVRICLEKEMIVIKPLPDTDELKIEIVRYQETDSENLFSDFSEMYFNYSWIGINTKGYSDVFLIATNQLHPNILILSEGSVLKLFKVESIKSE